MSQPPIQPAPPNHYPQHYYPYPYQYPYPYYPPYPYSVPRPPAQPVQQQAAAQPAQPTPATAPAPAAAPSSRPARRNAPSLKGVFVKDLRNLMYGFGDEFHAAPDTVNVMEEILIEYIGNVCNTALGPSRKARLQIEDLRRVLSHPADAKKLARMEELLFMQEDIKRARQEFEEEGPNNM
ncbi:TFIID-18kDa-domain-containing protein [Sistotremastrum niveocremeum HHB9708]|uniref:Transcription initiation factor TFIID subunit 13 n=1 Tax=Sistotremastrum niveocremeum HHB9708 TaxID=1314777 RepID=A0A165ALP5_9AGAM|nr:TFIID-18kDa-domain-containing protein [Sistotremastrum niveocremeum HHB9708]